jgi:DNA-nicking Smr family endonuclease
MRRTTREEHELFRAAVSGGLPAKPKKSRPPVVQAEAPARKTPPAKVLSGLDGNTARRLKRGEIAPDAKIDLHGLTEADAHRALTAFVLSAHRRGDRLVLVVTGKSGVLRIMVPRWLEEAPLARVIADKRGAHVRHGGAGALYVYLRKARG